MKKYITVKTEERLPSERGFYITSWNVSTEFRDGFFMDIAGGIVNYKVDWWLEEGNEDELAELLQEAIDHLGETKWEDYQVETLANFCMNAQNVVWNHLNNAPNLLDD